MPYTCIDNVISRNEESQMFGPTVQLVKNAWLDDEKEKFKLENLINMPGMQDSWHHSSAKLLNALEISVYYNLIAQNSSIGASFEKIQSVKSYIDGCMMGQKFKDFSPRKITYHEIIKMCEQRCGLLAPNFTPGLPSTQRGVDVATTWVHRRSIREPLSKMTITCIEVDVAESFLKHVLEPRFTKQYRIRYDPRLRFEFWR